MKMHDGRVKSSLEQIIETDWLALVFNPEMAGGRRVVKLACGHAGLTVAIHKMI